MRGLDACIVVWFGMALSGALGCAKSGEDAAAPALDEAGSASGDPADAGQATEAAVDAGSDDAPDALPTVIDAGAPCVIGNGNQCRDHYYCGNTTDCITGTCVPIPDETSEYSPACGCDNVNYWNASVAASRFRVAIQNAGRCEKALVCCKGYGCSGVCEVHSGLTCVANEGFEAMGGCNSGAIGIAGLCWGGPTTCPSGPNVPRVQRCNSLSVRRRCMPRCQAMFAVSENFIESSQCP